MDNIELKIYTILEEIGKGGGGTVYKAYHNRLQEIVVLKKINDSWRALNSKRQEVDILKKLNHSYLPHVIDFLESDEGVFTVLNFIEGKSFQELLNEGRHFSKAELIKWAKQLCSALDYLHSQKVPVIHGDIKPSNIMLTSEGNICLIDFNISFFMDRNTVLGYSRGYTSPEQFWAFSSRRKRENSRYVINQKSDIYSIGATLYHLATGNVRADYNHGIDLNRLESAVGIPFSAVIAKATSINAADRFESAADMLDAIEKITENDERYRKLINRQYIKTGACFAAALICLLMSAAGFMLMQDERYDKYDSLVKEQKLLISEGNYDKSVEKLNEATKLIPKEIEARYWQADSLYQQGKYEESIEYINDYILNEDKVKKAGESRRKSVVDVYVLKGLDYIELENGAAAVKEFTNAQNAGKLSGNNYRDYAIALAYDEMYDEAEKMLSKAESMGENKAGTAYTRGEIEFARSNYNDALKKFRYCIENTEDSYMQMRAYIMEDKIYRKSGNLSGSRSVLQQAVNQLPEQNQYAILERLAQTNIDLKYYDDAKDCMRKIINNSWATWQDYDTLAYLYYMTDDLTSMTSPLEAMKNMDFRAKYRIDMWYALAAIKEKNYSLAEKYYLNAENAYQGYERGNITDNDMETLRNEYRQLLEGGWL